MASNCVNSFDVSDTLSLIAIVISGIAIFFSYYSMKNDQGNTEITLFKYLHEAEKDLIEYKNNSDEEMINFGLVSILNYYETYCSMYLDKKINRSYFKSMYKGNLTRIYQDEEYRVLILKASDDGQSDVGYEKIIAVLTEWGVA